MMKPSKGFWRKIASIVSIVKDVALILIALYEMIRR